MLTLKKLDKIAINAQSHNILKQILKENPSLADNLQHAKNETEALIGVKNWVLDSLKTNTKALKYYTGETSGLQAMTSLKWRDIAAIRILDYIDNAGVEIEDLNQRGEKTISNPIALLWMAVVNGTGGTKPSFFEDMLQLFRQFNGVLKKPTIKKDQLEKWMARFPSGLDPRIIKVQEENKTRILNIIIDKIDKGKKKDPKFKFNAGMKQEQKFKKALEWWNDRLFHLRFAVRKADELNEMLDYSLDPDTMKILYDAEKAGIPFFVNPYYLSLLFVRVPHFAFGADLAIRDYVLYSRQLVEEFGQIVAWEKEDQVEPGKPNAAGWLLPSNCIHRRYPDVAILIPETVGRSCGGLCSSCQRMYGFQKEELNFNLNKLEPKEAWKTKLTKLMKYFEEDSQLRDILITGGDALMSSNKSLKLMLDALYNMAKSKKAKNKKRESGKKYAELIRIRLGTKLPVYLPQRMTPELVKILADFKAKASKIGVKQFVIQTHFESPLEITPESELAIKKLLSAGWIVTNQLVFTTAASRRGHTAKLRQALNDVGVLSYYTFCVKGYMENYHHFATNGRAVQEQLEEKVFGSIPKKYYETIKKYPLNAEKIRENISNLRETAGLPFLATDRNVLNLPGVGKSITYRVIGITRDGRRVLEFDHDSTRAHSPIIKKMGKIMVIESKSIGEYMNQIKEMGEDLNEYESLYGYSIGETEDRIPIYEYPDYSFEVTKDITNLKIPHNICN